MSKLCTARAAEPATGAPTATAGFAEGRDRHAGPTAQIWPLPTRYIKSDWRTAKPLAYVLSMAAVALRGLKHKA